MGFLDSYEPVATRIARYWAEHANDGSITTELVTRTDTDVVIRAVVWAGERILGTGYAQETVTNRGVNSTSSVENCETSAIGRALANAGYAPTGARPSREEMSKVNPLAERVRALVERVKAEGFGDQVKALGLSWPWDANACEQVDLLIWELTVGDVEDAF